jgi:hypothetical protein
VVSKIRVAKNGRRSGGHSFSRGALYELLANPIYIGEIRHKQIRHPGQHQAIVGTKLWEEVQQRLHQGSAGRGPRSKSSSSPLMGKLFDATGERLTPSHAVKNGRRYRYYVSAKLLRGPNDKVRDGWRLAAAELERSVAAAARRMLGQRTRIASVLSQTGMSALEIQQTLEAADEYHRQLASGPQPLISKLTSRVTLAKDSIELSLNLAPLLPESVQIKDPVGLTITEFIPLQMKRRGVETKLVIKDHPTEVMRTDRALLLAVARGHHWFGELASGTATSTVEIAKREGLNDSYVRRLLPLAFLAPAIIEAVSAGRQPSDLTAEKLTRAVSLPLAWSEQQRLLCFD